jgi:ABC-type multidrug transport system ATPase subunit
MNSEAFRLRGLCQRFSRGFLRASAEALVDVDLELARGENLGLVGANGSGKSSLLRILAGIDPPSAGSVQVLGGSPREDAVRARLGLAAEDSRFPPELGARAVLELGAALKGVVRSARGARADQLLELVGLAGHARERVGGFSRGMLRRLALAQAEIAAPDLLLLDEPGSGLDAEGYGALRTILERVRARGASAVLCSHLAAEVYGNCERLAVLAGGRLVAAGTPGSLLGLERDGRAELELEGLTAPTLEQMRKAAAAGGALVVAVRPSQSAMLRWMGRRSDEAAPDRSRTP